jgi:hypothetical protein
LKIKYRIRNNKINKKKNYNLIKERIMMKINKKLLVNLLFINKINNNLLNKYNKNNRISKLNRMCNRSK